MCVNIFTSVLVTGVCVHVAADDVRVGWVGLICGIHVASKTGLG